MTTLPSAFEMVDAQLFKPTKPEYLHSFGDCVVHDRRWKFWQVINSVLTTWNDLHDRIRALVRRRREYFRKPNNYRGPQEPPYLLKCYMIGHSSERASPHVVVICDKEFVRTGVRDIILSDGILLNNDVGWGRACLRLKAPIEQPASMRKFAIRELDSPTTGRDDYDLRSHPGSKLPPTLCGMGLDIYGPGLSLRTATIGGVVYLAGAYYAMTVAHVLDSEETPTDLSDDDSITFDPSDLDIFVDGQSPDFGEGGEVRINMFSERISPRSTRTEGGELGLEIGGTDVSLKPMARRLDLVERARASNDTDQTLLGRLERRFVSVPDVSDGSNYDWALIEIEHDQWQRPNRLESTSSDGTGKGCITVRTVEHSPMPEGLKVLFATCRGLISGEGIASTAAISASSLDSSNIWTVKLEDIQPGDCGCWVVNAADGNLLGMLVATCRPLNEAYIMPAYSIFSDIEKRLKKGPVSLSLMKPKFRQIVRTVIEERRWSDTYTYRPLPDHSMRLLTLLPGKEGSDIECTIAVRENDDVSYEALSYVWDTTQMSSTINVLSRGRRYFLEVAPNLQSALRRLRYRNKPRVFWVDACINIRDDKEKRSQIPQSVHRFHQATQVCIWLGEEDQDSQVAFNLLRGLLDLNIDKALGDGINLKSATALSALMSRSWFRRRWCVSEVALARRATLICGSLQMDWEDFEDAVALLQHVAQYSPQGLLRDLSSSRKFHSPSNLELSDDERLDRRDYLGSVRALDASHVVKVTGNAFLELSDDERLDRRDYLGNIHALDASHVVKVTRNTFRKADDGRIVKLMSLERLVTTMPLFQVSYPHDVIYSLVPLAKDARGISRPSSTSSRRRFIAEKPKSEIFDIYKKIRINSLVWKAIDIFRKPLESRAFLVDYSKPFYEICEAFVLFSIRKSKSLDIICRPWAPDDSQLPSWVSKLSRAAFARRPDGRLIRINGDILVGYPESSSLNVYRAAGSKQPLWADLEPAVLGRNLFVDGFVLDIVDEDFGRCIVGNVPSEWLNILGWTDLSSSRSAPPPDRLWRTLVADRSPDGGNPPSWYRRACRAALESLTGDDLNVSDIVQRCADSAIRGFLERVQRVVWNRRLVRTRSQRLVGLVPKETKINDIICILYGCSVPVVLRIGSTEMTSKIHYTVIGECYIDGIMDGEALDIKRQRRIEKETFRLQ